MQHQVFVYGTLLRGEVNHHLLAGARFLGTHRTAPCFSLVLLGAYPGAVRVGDTALVGEVFRLDTAGLKSEARMSALEFLRANDALLPPGLPDWMQPLRRSLRYLALVRQRTTPSHEPSGDPPRLAPAAHHRQSARIGV